MMAFFNKHKKIFISSLTLICLITIFVTVTYNVRPALLNNIVSFFTVPIQGALSSVSRFVGDKTSVLFNLTDLESENARLKAENEQLLFANSRLRSVEAENERLSELLNTQLKYAEYPNIGAHVIATDMGNWYDTFLIDKGKNDGVQKNMVVIGAGGLIGRVTEVWEKSSKVVSLIDDTSSVAAKCARTEDTGYVRGDINLMMEGLCRMEHIREDAQLMVGDEIITSHLSSIYPPGITIGIIKEVGASSNGTKYAIIEPTVNFEGIETVLIINKVFEKLYPDDALDVIDYENMDNM